MKYPYLLEGDEGFGPQIVRKAIESPLRNLCANAGVDASLVIQRVLDSTGNEGYNVTTGEYTDLVSDGVLDPTKVTRTALQNAASVAGMLLTTECMVTEMVDENAAAPAMPPGMDGGMGGMGGMM